MPSLSAGWNRPGDHPREPLPDESHFSELYCFRPTWWSFFWCIRQIQTFWTAMKRSPQVGYERPGTVEKLLAPSCPTGAYWSIINVAVQRVSLPWAALFRCSFKPCSQTPMPPPAQDGGVGWFRSWGALVRACSLLLRLSASWVLIPSISINFKYIFAVI